jgi:hypothetical protein
MKHPTDIKFIMCCNAEHQNILLQDEQHLCHLNTPIDTIRWLVTYTGRYANIWGLQVTDRYCEHIPDRVISVNGTTGMKDVPVITDRTVPSNRPDRVLHDKKEKTCLLIDITLPDDSNVNTK